MSQYTQIEQILRQLSLNPVAGAAPMIRSEQLSTAAGFLGAQFGVKRGIEKENLRVRPDGLLATTPHPPALGASLTHPEITTDFSEGLLEIITPPLSDVNALQQHLLGLQQYVYERIDAELLWAASMPPSVLDPVDIMIANFGQSQLGQRKRIYREGLALRYGKIMEVIAGIHFNFSFPQDLLQQLVALTGSTKSDLYLAQVRQLWRYMWQIPYLFGASPAAARTSVTGAMPACLQAHGQCTVLGPEATSMRLGGLGYHNKGRELIAIDYSSIKAYACSLQRATQTPFAEYEQIASGQTAYRQLNANVLQIENELYSPVRPKQIITPGQTPSEALCQRGVEYIELRALDLDPFCAQGISDACIAFLDVMMFHSMLSNSPGFKPGELEIAERNIARVAAYGRRPRLLLEHINGKQYTLNDLAQEHFAEFTLIAKWLDKQQSNDGFYADAVSQQAHKLTQPELTPSAQIIEALLQGGLEHDAWVMQQSEKNKQTIQQQPVNSLMQQQFEALSVKSQRDFEELSSSSS